jgi:hypothetical protein
MEKRKNPDRPLCFDPPPDASALRMERKKKKKKKNGKPEKWEGGVINEVYIYPEGRLVVDSLSHTHTQDDWFFGWLGGWVILGWSCSCGRDFVCGLSNLTTPRLPSFSATPLPFHPLSKTNLRPSRFSSFLLGSFSYSALKLFRSSKIFLVFLPPGLRQVS